MTASLIPAVNDRRKSALPHPGQRSGPPFACTCWDSTAEEWHGSVAFRTKVPNSHRIRAPAGTDRPCETPPLAKRSAGTVELQLVPATPSSTCTPADGEYKAAGESKGDTRRPRVPTITGVQASSASPYRRPGAFGKTTGARLRLRRRPKPSYWIPSSTA